MKESVILLHGMGRSRLSMALLAARLRKQGFATLNVGYPSTRQTIERLSDKYLAPAIAKCKAKGAERIHLVTHSLGGIISRYYLQGHRLPKGSRIVMLSPPNKGSEVTDAMKSRWLYQVMLGPAGQVLGTDDDSLPNRLKTVEEEVGIITGDRSSDPWFEKLFPGANDGKVSVERSQLDEMVDFLVVNTGHTFIMNSMAVMKQVVYFLQHGSFDRDKKIKA
ncbi:esterase/lipase family protein [Sulfuriflexus mobilis]|uniref:esterase/lipase family protein n=1 Tax=Sulfuriflexus mobilis TaxID=1811807 RepID=UPI000F84571E|nr:alpha/beta fold hydrolase [Sulfuriflexus mobilis]